MANIPTEPSAQPGEPLTALKDVPLPAAEPELAAAADEAKPGCDIEPLPGSLVALDVPLAEAVAVEAELAPPEAEAPPPETEAAPVVGEAPPPPPPTHLSCPVCTTVGPIDEAFCGDCGYHFTDADRAAVMPAGAAAAAVAAGPAGPLQGRYELGELISDRLGVQRYRAVDRGDGTGQAVPVVVIKQALPQPEPPPMAQAVELADEVPEDPDEIMPTFDDPLMAAIPATEVIYGEPIWPSVAWERKLLRTLEHPGLPVERDYFTDDAHEYLVEEVPTGRLLWDAWDDPDAPAAVKFGHLAALAETLQRLHQCNAMLEGLRPDIVVIADDGQVRLSDLSDLLPLPMPEGAPIRGRLYTAPELLSGGAADARADLYSFGAMLFALHVHRELNEKTDFDGPGNPKPFIPHFPDCHPAFGRLMMKTFRKEVEARFPTDEAGKEDATGFTELIRTLHGLRRTFDTVRLEIAAWTSIGIVRTGNEDAFCLMHATESRQDDIGEAALVLLCDGMGGYEAGEIAAAITLQSLRQNLSQLRPFSAAAGGGSFTADPVKEWPREGHATHSVDVDACKQAIKAALREANRLVFQTSRAPGSKRRGMGCTAEAVYVDGHHVIVGHVGDSRTYHLHEGRLIQLTRDQTLVNRLVELGSLTAEEAETHPRRNELQQAIGGQPDVEPGLYQGKMSPGDWVLVCSDGLINHVKDHELKQMMLSEAVSAETCARRLVNLTLINGATDNVTVVAIRAT